MRKRLLYYVLPVILSFATIDFLWANLLHSKDIAADIEAIDERIANNDLQPGDDFQSLFLDDLNATGQFRLHSLSTEVVDPGRLVSVVYQSERRLYILYRQLQIHC